MASVPSTAPKCILLVGADPSSSARTEELLRLANYQVLLADQGEDALRIVFGEEHEVHLVLTAIKLPDMCSFEFVQTIDEQFRLPVVMVHDTYDVPSIMRGLLHGAVYCFVKPLCCSDIDRLPLFCSVRDSYCSEDECELPENPEGDKKIPEAVYDIEHSLEKIKKKRRIGEEEKPEGTSMNPPSSFPWTASLNDKFTEVVLKAGLENVDPDKILQRINEPELTIEAVTEKYQKFKSGMQLHLQVHEQYLEVLASQDPTFPTDKPLKSGNSKRYKLACNFRFQCRLVDFMRDPNITVQLKAVVRHSLLRWIMGGEYPVHSIPKPRYQPSMRSGQTSLGVGRIPMPWTWPVPAVPEKIEMPAATVISQASSYTPDNKVGEEFSTDPESGKKEESTPDNKVRKKGQPGKKRATEKGKKNQLPNPSMIPAAAAAPPPPDAAEGQDDDTACSSYKN